MDKKTRLCEFGNSMAASSRDKVIEVFHIYAEGGSCQQARQAAGISANEFYAALRQASDLQTEYDAIQRARADMNIDEAYALSMCETADPKRVRVQAEIRTKIAGFYDRRKFGERVDLGIGPSVDVIAAIAEAKSRLPRPMRDPAQIIDGQFTELPPTIEARTPDKQSEGAVLVAQNPSQVAPFVNPFDD